jgi:predicted O-linked N-acetylglucosamine transferase (SPINDLY family)
LFHAGKWEAAEQAIDALNAVADPRIWAYRGAIHLHTNRMPAAEQCFRQAIAANPHDATSWHHLSIALHCQGRLEEAESSAQQAVAVDATQSAFQLHLGNVLFAREKFVDATRAFELAVQADRSSVIAWINLAAAHHVQKHWLAAREAYEASLDLEPNQFETRLKLIDVIERMMLYSEAEKMANELTTHDPQSAEAWCVLGRVQLNLAKQTDAIQALQRANNLAPTPLRHSRLLQALQYADRTDPASVLAAHTDWNHKYALPLRPTISETALHSHLKFGFVSADFGLSPIGHMVLPLFQALDQRRCSITCYFDNREEDRLTPEFRRAADRWRVTYGLSDEAFADQIRGDKIDVLIDLMGHAGNRLLVFARKPAPVQITWFGYVGTTGLQTMDYLLADRFHVPPGEERYFVETVLRMPNGYACYGPPSDAPPPESLPAMTKGYVTFGCFNFPAKWTPQIIDLWSAILREVPTARLFLKYYGLHDPQTQELIRSQFRERRIDAQRILMEGGSEHSELLNAYNRIDIALDTQPYSGGVTTCESLWMGVPVITWPGKTFAGRHATSHLTNAGYEQFVARNSGDYVRLATDWANRLDELAAIRSQMRDRLRQSPLCDTPRFASDFLAVLANAITTAAG